MGVPAEALEMFRTANALSGLDRETLPTELIPLNTLQLSRGLLNYTILQSIPSWVLPYWAHQQYAPDSQSFVPRSHLGLSINITHRNWTAVGNPECAVEPVVDPRGMVTPFTGGWSLDTWLETRDGLRLPSCAPHAEQFLLENFPVVRTRFVFGDFLLTLTSWTLRELFLHSANVENRGSRREDCRLMLAIRPFNPEGVALVHGLAFERSTKSFLVNQRDQLLLDREPDAVHLSMHAEGDSARLALSAAEPGSSPSIACPAGLANGYAAFNISLDAGAAASVECGVHLGGGIVDAIPQGGEEAALAAWRETVADGMKIATPDPTVDAAYQASLATLLMLLDGSTVTPGPWTYHQFWFRDAAYMIWALDKSGFGPRTDAIVRKYPEYQESSGYFRSQKGEWDSNGQALWSAWQHSVYSRDANFAQGMFEALARGSRWIERKRIRGKGSSMKACTGLLPPGLSAEHLGLSDYYFWDDFWCLAGVEAFGRICAELGRTEELESTKELAGAFRNDIETAIQRVQHERSLRVIPAGPLRGIDCGMVGSLAAWYPLQVFPLNDPRLHATAGLLMDRFGVDGMFFQHFIHSGKNPYLTLHLAHAWLWAGMRQRFWDRLAAVLAHATSTLNFPEAIHPLTGGGSMGDGHHGWAAAELVLAVRDAFVFEEWNSGGHRLRLLAGIPAAWYQNGAPFSMKRTAIPGGRLSIAVQPLSQGPEVEITLEESALPGSGDWVLMLPFSPAEIRGSRAPYTWAREDNGETAVRLRAGSDRMRITWQASSS